MTETEPPVTMRTFRRGMVKIEGVAIKTGLANYCSSKECWMHRAFLILITKVSRNSVLLHKHIVTADGTELSIFVVTLPKEIPIMHTKLATPKTLNRTFGKIMSIMDWKENCETQMDIYVEISIDRDRNPESGKTGYTTWRTF